MARMIDADALDDIVGKLNANGMGITRGEYKIMDAVLFEFPTIEERKKGKWIRTEDGLLICNQCGNTAEYNMIDCSFMYTPFCNECGADMRGEEHD